MFSEKSEQLAEQLIAEEYNNAKKEYGDKYHSLHEGYAVLLEEVEEVNEEKKLLDNIVSEIWYKTKQNELEKKDVEQALCQVMYTIQELAQVGAVLIKNINTLEQGKAKRKVCNPDCKYIYKRSDRWACSGQRCSPFVKLGEECFYEDEVEE